MTHDRKHTRERVDSTMNPLDHEIDKAVDYLANSSTEAAQAIANHSHLTDFTKVLIAQLKAKCRTEESDAAKTSWALAHEDYKTHIEAVKIAQEIALKHKFLREACQTKIDVWRTKISYKKTLGDVV